MSRTTTTPVWPTVTPRDPGGGRSARSRRLRRLRRLRRRVVALAGLAWLRATFLVLQAVAPRAADRRALDVWCTLPPGARRRRPDHRPPDGEVVRLDVPRGGAGVAEVWGEGPVVYLVHGWGGWRGQLGAFVAPLVAAGHRVVALDAPGHGDAEAGLMGPRRGTLVEMVDALAVAHATFGPARAVVAHSLGSTATTLALRDGLAAERVVLVSPNPGFEHLLARFGATLGLRRRTLAHLRAALEEFLERPIDDVDVARLAARGDVPRALVVHDEADGETPHAVGAAVAAAWPGARLLTTRGLGHYRVLADPTVVDAVVGHVAADPAQQGS